MAAELLVPLELVRAEDDADAPLQAETSRLVRRFKVSTSVVLRRIHDAGGITRDELWTAYRAELAHVLERPRASGGNVYLTLPGRVGMRFARALVTSTLEGRTAFTESFRLLGVKKMDAFRELGHHLGVGF